jgi:hypothetical protein
MRSRSKRDHHERTRTLGERLIVKQLTLRPNDPYPGIQDVGDDERSQLAGNSESSGEVREMEASQMGAGVWPLSVRRKSVLVNEIPVELGEAERDKEVRTIVV